MFTDNMENSTDAATNQIPVSYTHLNKAKEGVVTTPSVLQYKIITKGNGAVPADSSKVKVNYKGTLIDGTEFDSSYKRNEPATFRADVYKRQGWNGCCVFSSLSISAGCLYGSVLSRGR